jgi:hypothetical protein
MIRWTIRLAWYFGLVYLTRPTPGWYLDLHRLFRIGGSDRMYVTSGSGYSNGSAMIRLRKTTRAPRYFA